MDRAKQDFSTLTLVMIPVAIAINIAVGQLIYTVKIPLSLDSLGTVWSVLAGPWPAVPDCSQHLGLTGLNVICALRSRRSSYRRLAGLFSDAGWLRAWWKVILAGSYWAGGCHPSAPISAYVFGGVGAGTDVIVAIFRGMGFGILPSTFAQGITSDPLDKAISFLVVWLIVQALPLRFVMRFPRAENVKSA
jgi:energy-coupling factor transport system substrate-specific component